MKRMHLALLVLVCLAACSAPPQRSPIASQQSAPPPPEIRTQGVSGMVPSAPNVADGIREVKWLIPVLMSDSAYAEAQAWMKGLLISINEKLLSHDRRLDIELRQITRTSVYNDAVFSYSVTDDIQTIVASGEAYDLISLPTHAGSAARLIQEGLLKEISGDIAAYPGLSAALHPQQLEMTRYKDRIYGIPAGLDWDESVKRTYVGARRDVMERIGMESITSLDELIEAGTAAKLNALSHSIYFSYNPDVYRRTYPEYPFKVSGDCLFLFDKDGHVDIYLESDVWSQDLSIAQAVQSINEYPEEYKRFDEIDFNFINIWSSIEADSDDYIPIKLAPAAPQILYDNPFGKILNVVPATADGLYGLEILNWIYENRDVYDMFRNEQGLFAQSEGIHLAIVSPATQFLIDFGIPEDNPEQYRYMFDLENFYYTLFDCIKQGETAEATEQNESDATRIVLSDMRYEKMPWYGFTFDPTPVLKIYSDVVVHASLRTQGGRIHGIFRGTQTSKDITEILSNMREHGLDLVLAECRKQYAAFLEARGWVG